MGNNKQFIFQNLVAEKGGHSQTQIEEMTQHRSRCCMLQLLYTCTSLFTVATTRSYMIHYGVNIIQRGTSSNKTYHPTKSSHRTDADTQNKNCYSTSTFQKNHQTSLTINFPHGPSMFFCPQHLPQHLTIQRYIKSQVGKG